MRHNVRDARRIAACFVRGQKAMNAQAGEGGYWGRTKVPGAPIRTNAILLRLRHFTRVVPSAACPLKKWLLAGLN